MLSHHMMLLLLWSSFVISKVLYILRTAPSFLSPELAGIDALLRHLFCSILNVAMKDDSTLLQANLPVSCGGIGIRRSVQLAPSAYLVSATGCFKLIPQIMPSHLKSSFDLHVECVLNIRSIILPLPFFPLAISMRGILIC